MGASSGAVITCRPSEGISIVQAAMHDIAGVHKSDELMAVELQPPFSELNEARSPLMEQPVAHLASKAMHELYEMHASLYAALKNGLFNLLQTFSETLL